MMARAKKTDDTEKKPVKDEKPTEETPDVDVTRDEDGNVTALVGYGWAVSFDPNYGVWHIREDNWVGPSQIVAKKDAIESLRDLLAQLP